jgi:uncharacterized protein (DUF2267 family)
MELTQILERATENTGLNQAQAETALPAFLETLSLRLTEDEQQDLAAQLPEELQGTLHATDPDVEKLSPDQFVERFAQRAGIDRDAALGAVHGLWEAVAEAVSPGEAEEVFSQLPTELAQLFRKG